ncbi:hypothetical protein [Cognatilysobacter bugurensis]|nr:hypothetical protein [Lysobacter bugurensis]
MVAFAKAQSLEAVLSCAPTPEPERYSTLGLLWGVTLAHARALRCGETVALEAAAAILSRVPGGQALLGWIREHRNAEEFQAWAELGEMAVHSAAEVNDPMPALLELAHEYRETTHDRAFPHSGAMPMPGVGLLEERARRAPPMSAGSGWHAQR